MWRDRLGVTAADKPMRHPSARHAVQKPVDGSIESLRRQRDAEDRSSAHAQAERDSTLSQISEAERAGSRRKKPPPPLPPPAPLLRDSAASRSDTIAGAVTSPPAQQADQNDLLAAIRGGVAQRAERRMDVSQLEGRLQDRYRSGATSNVHIAQLSDALSGLRRQVGPQGTDSDETDSDEQGEDDDGWLSDDGDVVPDATRHHWARPRVQTAPAASAPEDVPRIAAPAPAPAEDTARVDLPPGIRLSRSALQNSSQSRAQEPE